MGYEEKRGIKEKLNVFGNWIDELLLIERRLTPENQSVREIRKFYFEDTDFKFVLNILVEI